eukprot:gene23013-30206_t
MLIAHPRQPSALAVCKSQEGDDQSSDETNTYKEHAKKYQRHARNYFGAWADDCGEMTQAIMTAITPRQPGDIRDIGLLLISTTIFMWLGAAMYYVYFTLFFG